MDDVEITNSIFDTEQSFDAYLRSLTTSTAQSQSGLEGTGSKCEIADFDSVYNSEGDTIVVYSGAKYDVGRDQRIVDDLPAIARTTYWDKLGIKTSTQVEIRSPPMKSALKSSVPEYKSRNFSHSHITIRGQPRNIFHSLNDLFKYGAGLEQGSVEQHHVSLLMEFLQQELADAISAHSTHVKFQPSSPTIDFRHLWTIFERGDLIYVHSSLGIDRAEGLMEYKSLKPDCTCDDPSHFGHHHYSFTGRYIDNNGEALIYRDFSTRVSHFDGFRPLKELSVVPVHFLPDQDDIKARLKARGQRFVALQGVHHRHFTGQARLNLRSRYTELFQVKSGIGMVTRKVNSRIMIDHATFTEDAEVKGLRLPAHSGLNDMQLMLCCSHIGGFSFEDKSWGRFHVDHIQPIAFDRAVFKSCLMLEEKYKNILLSLIRLQEAVGDDSFNDIVKGKGKGVVFLLHGEPGVGKTMTAETIADCCERPLLRVDTNKLCDTGVGDIESSLTRVLRLAERWKAVALLDEADIFLEQRSQEDVRRNSMVTAFLRVLEYFDGVLFLTTNRINVFDPAFKSRIQVAIHYPPLDTKSRLQLLKLFASRASHQSRPDDEWVAIVKDVASEKMNGRQIRDVVRIAQAAAFGEGMAIEERHLREGVDALRVFESEFEKGRAPPSSKKRRRYDVDWETEESYES